MKHKDDLKLLQPIQLNNDAELAIDGKHLDKFDTYNQDIFYNIFPNTAVELLPFWERTLALIYQSDAIIQQRQTAIITKLNETGGLSIPYFTNLAAARGWNINIIEYIPFRADFSAAGDPIYDREDIYKWTVEVNTIENRVYPFRANLSQAGDQVQHIDTIDDLETLFNNLKPAHTICEFLYE